MRIKDLKILPLLVLFMLYFPAFGLDKPLVEYIHIEDGLPQNTIQAIEKDAFGFMWFGTDNGLCRFDGNHFVYYYSGDSKSGLLDNRILDLTAGNKHNLWVTSQKGLQRFDLLTGKFMPITQIDILQIFRLDVIETQFFDNELWVVTTANGVYRLSVENDQFQLIGHYYKDEDLPHPLCLFKSKNGNPIMGTENGLFVFNPQTNDFEDYFRDNPEILPGFVQSVYEDDNYLYMGTNNGLLLLNRQNRFLEWYTYNETDENSLWHPSVTALLKVNDNELLIGTLGGFCHFMVNERKCERVSLYNKEEEQGQVEFISCLYADEQGNVWIGTEKVGLAHYNLYQKKFNSFEDYPDLFDPINKGIINSIYKSGNTLWVGTAGTGLIKANPQKQTLKHYRAVSDQPGKLESNFITSINQDKKNNMWIATWGMGLQKQAPGRNTFTAYRSEKGLPNHFISSIYFNSKNQMVVGTEGGLCIYNEKQDQFYTINPRLKSPTKVWEVSCIMEDNKGYYWIGTTAGLYRFHTNLVHANAPTTISQYDLVVYKETDEKNSLPNNHITCITTDKSGKIWLGTYGGGIVRCVETEGGNYTFETLQQSQGLANNVVYTILCDDKNDLWISTDNGLSRYQQETGHFINYYRKDGLRNNQYYWSAAYKDKEGFLYFGGLYGLNFFHPDSIQTRHFPIKNVITTLNIANKKVLPGEEHHGRTPLKKAAFASDTITLSYKDNVFSLEFSALNYSFSSKIKYAYRLSGVDKDWVEVNSTQRVATYTNLAGGLYTFEVKSTNPEGIMEDNITRLYINVIPPIWQTIAFKAAMLILIILLFTSYVQYRSYNISKQKKRLEKLVKQRTLEIEEKNHQLEEHSNQLTENNLQLENKRDEIEKQKTLLEHQNEEIVKQRDQLITLNEEIESIHQMRMQFFTNISHEFRTPLTLIISPLERIVKEQSSQLPETIHHAIKMVKRNAERLLMLTNQILTFRKLEADKLQVILNEGMLDTVLEEIGEVFTEMAQIKNISYSIEVAPGNYAGWYDKLKLENVLFNLLSNAFKYTPVDGKISMTLNLLDKKDLGKCIEVKITDSGDGIKPENLDKVFERFYRADNTLGFGTGIGLSLVKELIEKQNGEISVSSNYGNGACFCFVLPIEISAFENYTLANQKFSEPLSLKDKVDLIKESVIDNAEVETTNSGNKPALLVVEDNDDLRHFMVKSFSDTYYVLSARDGQEGYELALKNNLDLVVSDIMMPRLNGLDLCKQLKNNLNTSHLPVVLLSAKGMEENQLEGLGVGADDYITKPFNFALLQAKLKSLLENRLKLRGIYLHQNGEEPVEKSGTLDDEFMKKVNDVVSDNYTEPSFGVEEFSSKMFISRSLLYKKLKALTNVSPNEYINIFRLRKSVPLLQSKKYQVAEVAIMVGFNDPKYFSRVFKKFYKCSPIEYANKG